MERGDGGIADVAVVGAGAAGLMAAITASRARPSARVIALDGARHLGRKILIAGGGRCNVTHETVDASAFAGSSAPAIRKILRRFDVPRTIAFFRELGVELKRESTGKLFPTTDRSETVLAALIDGATRAGVELRNPARVLEIHRRDHGFDLVVEGTPGVLPARRVVLASGGRSLPGTGSDGSGYSLARDLGHGLTERILPGLVPLRLPEGHPLTGLSGVSTTARLDLRTNTGRRICNTTGPVLCTHFGVSGPAVLDISRHYLTAQFAHPGAHLVVSWLPVETPASLDALLLSPGTGGPARRLRSRLPERLVRMLCGLSGMDPSRASDAQPAEARRRLIRHLLEFPLPVTGSRGFQYAEVTAGGVPLDELRLDTLESRRCPGLHLCGEICDVDGRIGGFNFQWAWASGHVAGRGVAVPA